MNMKTGSRIITALSMAALLLVSAACKQASSEAQISADQKAVDEAAGKITGQVLTTIRDAFSPKLTNGNADIPTTTTTVSVDTSKISIDQGINASVSFKGPKNATSKIEKAASDYTVTHGTAEEKWDVFVVLTKNKAFQVVKIGSYTVKAAAQSTKTPLTVADITKITVDGVQAAGASSPYTVTLDSAKFAALAAGIDTTKVVITDGAISGIASGDQTSDVFKITVADASPNKTITIELADGEKGKDKYEFTAITITVSQS